MRGGNPALLLERGVMSLREVQIKRWSISFGHCDGNWDNGVSSSCKFGLVESIVYEVDK
jgi:hypothetical protein